MKWLQLSIDIVTILILLICMYLWYETIRIQNRKWDLEVQNAYQLGRDTARSGKTVTRPRRSKPALEDHDD